VRIGDLLQKAKNESWLLGQDIAWETPVSPERLRTPEPLCSIADLDAYRKMPAKERDAYRLKETAWALSNLVYGEERGALLGAQVIVDRLEAGTHADDAEFLGVLVAEEARHHEALARYMNEKIGIAYAPHRAMIDLFRALQKHPLWELKVIVGQILFEPTACSMLHSLLIRAEEPLLFDLVRRILRDEARHLTYSYSVAGGLVRRLKKPELKEAEDLLFESIVGCVTAFMPIEPWAEHGLPLTACKQSAVEALEKRGVIEFFGKVMPAQLARHGFPSTRLRDRVHHDLAKTLGAR
jgi:hypothetical protein